jgi:mannitol/fructose-specific phosphotransferase system IIA component (Ntr-type)
MPKGGEVRGVLGISSAGLDLDAEDCKLVHAVVLLATPESKRNRHLEILAAFASAITRDDNLREQLYHARSAAHAYQILHADDTDDFNYFLDETLAEEF